MMKPRSGRNYKGITNGQIAEMIVLYVVDGLSYSAIARKFNINNTTVRYYVMKHYHGHVIGPTMTITLQSKLNDP